MSEHSKIEWTDHTFNPWWGCMKVSDGCRNCYAETFAKRVGQRVWGPPSTTTRREFSAKHWAEPLNWHAAALAEGKRARVFCASMADVFEDHPVAAQERPRLWETISACTSLDWLLLTKRPENIIDMLPVGWKHQLPPHIWIGTSTENQQTADERIPHLLMVPAAVRFLSMEPLLGPVDLEREVVLPTGKSCQPLYVDHISGRQEDAKHIDWVILGGESGHGYRDMDVQWVADIAEQCKAAGIAVFVKQDSGRYPAKQGRIPDELMLREFPASPAAVTA